MNGRFIPHFWIQLFDGIIGKSTFNFVNTLVFLFFLHFTTITANSANKRNNYFILSITIAILIFLLPEFRLAMLWMSGACNYLWSSLFLLIFHYLITHEYKNQLAYPFLFIYGIISGWTHEGLVIGLGVAFFIYFLIHKQQIKQSRIILLAGFYLGAVFLITSPGSISRLNGHEISTFAVTLKAYILAFIAMDSLRISYLFLFLLLFSKITKKITFKEFFSDNIIFFTALIISFIFIIFTKHTTEHSRFGIEFYALILTLKLINTNLNYNPILTSHIISLFTIIFSLYTINICKQNYNEYLSNIKQIEKGNSIIQTNEISLPHTFFEKFIVRHINSEKYGWYFMINSNSWYNKNIANYFNKDKLIFIPERVIKDIHNNPNKYLQFVSDSSLPFYIKKVSSNEENKITFTYKQTDFSSLPYYLRFIAPYMNKYTIKKQESNKDVNSIIFINDSFYLFVGKERDKDFRLEDIILE